MAVWLAVAIALAFALTNGFHDAANAIATLVATRGARPGQAVVVSATFNMLGALLVGTAVASTIAGVVTVEGADAVAVIGSAVLGAALWNLLTWWRGLPSSSGHALVGGLLGAAAVATGLDAVHWGGFEGWKPVGVLGVLIALALSPFIGLGLGLLLIRLARRLLDRATRGVRSRSHSAAGRRPRPSPSVMAPTTRKSHGGHAENYERRGRPVRRCPRCRRLEHSGHAVRDRRGSRRKSPPIEEECPCLQTSTRSGSERRSRSTRLPSVSGKN